VKEELKRKLDFAVEKKLENKKFFQNLAKKKPKNLDENFHKLHEQAFKTIDCLDCANCCKTTSPIFRDVDIKRISKALKVKESQFIQNYLRMDEDSDYVLKQSPCAFLGPDNKCQIYDIRPLACREYPHTDRKNMHQILGITELNTYICPAVSEIIEKLKPITLK
jgi:Fe-S-cluster containining protein